MDGQRWYEGEVLIGGLMSRRHAVLGASKEEIERRMRDRYLDAAVILARRDEDGGPARSHTTNKEVEP